MAHESGGLKSAWQKVASKTAHSHAGTGSERPATGLDRKVVFSASDKI